MLTYIIILSPPHRARCDCTATKPSSRTRDPEGVSPLYLSKDAALLVARTLKHATITQLNLPRL